MAQRNRSSWPQVVFWSLFFLFFFQLVADFVEAVYAFGLMSTGIPPQIVAVLLFLSPILWVLIPQKHTKAFPASVLYALFLLARVTYPLLDTYHRMLVAGVGVALTLLLFPWLLRREERGSTMAWGLAAATLLSALLRTWGTGLDASTVGWGQTIGGGLVLLAVWAWVYGRPAPDADVTAETGRGVLLPVAGLMSVLVLLYFVFTAPHVLSHWTDIPYPWVGLLYALGAAAALGWLPRLRASPRLWAANGLLVLSLTLTAWLNQPQFPSSPDAYPFPAPPSSWLSALCLALTLFLYPVLFLDAAHLAQEVIRRRPSARRLGWAFTLAAFLFLVAIFAHVFTTVYDYIPVVGPFFRNRFWHLHLALGFLLLVSLKTTGRVRSALGNISGRTWAVGVAGTLLLVVSAWALAPHPQPPRERPRALTVMTYNIQQGYSETGERNFDGQLALIRRVGPDILGLEETDDARVAGGNADVPRYFARHLNMYAYYGPQTPVGTFGIALLSRYPIRAARTWYLYSTGEQVAVIEARVDVGGRLLPVFVTHLGNGGPMVQQEQFLRLVADTRPLVAMGDFNFPPGSSQYRMTTRVLVDTWTARWPTWADDRGIRPLDKIDHIFVSPDITVLDARYLISPASDHPAVTATVAWKDND